MDCESPLPPWHDWTLQDHEAEMAGLKVEFDRLLTHQSEEALRFINNQIVALEQRNAMTNAELVFPSTGLALADEFKLIDKSLAAALDRLAVRRQYDESCVDTQRAAELLAATQDRDAQLGALTDMLRERLREAEVRARREATEDDLNGVTWSPLGGLVLDLRIESLGGKSKSNHGHAAATRSTHAPVYRDDDDDDDDQDEYGQYAGGGGGGGGGDHDDDDDDDEHTTLAARARNRRAALALPTSNFSMAPAPRRKPRDRSATQALPAPAPTAPPPAAGTSARSIKRAAAAAAAAASAARKVWRGPCIVYMLSQEDIDADTRFFYKLGEFHEED